MNKIQIIVYKFFDAEVANELFEQIKSGATPYDKFLLNCDSNNCKNCTYYNSCLLEEFQRIVIKAGNVYSLYVDGQARSQFLN